MADRKHLAYFYRFKMPASCNDVKSIFENYKVINAEDNYRSRGKHGILFIADAVENEYVFGRILKIRLGRVRRINLPGHNEWYDYIKKENGIEQEAHVLISLKDEIMLTEYNSEAFGILPQYIFDYFRETINCRSEEMRFAKLTLPQAFEKLVTSREIDTLKINVQGDLTGVMDDLGFANGKVIRGGENEIPISLNLTARYSKRGILTRENLNKLVETFRRKGLKTKTAVMETEKGYFSLISDTLLNGEIFYDNEVESSDSQAFNSMKALFVDKTTVVKEALELVMKESLDYYEEN